VAVLCFFLNRMECATKLLYFYIKSANQSTILGGCMSLTHQAAAQKERLPKKDDRKIPLTKASTSDNTPLYHNSRVTYTPELLHRKRGRITNEKRK